MKVKVLISKSARITKSMRGAVALIAKTSVKVADDEHESSIKKGEKFYLKKLGSRFYLMDKEGKDYYQFGIDKKKYDQLMKKHEVASETESAPKSKLGAFNPNAQVAKNVPEVRKALGNLKDFKELQKDKQVKEYEKLKAQHRKSSTFPNRAAKTAELEKQMKTLAKQPSVKKYSKITANGVADSDIIGKALEKHDPTYAQTSKLMQAAQKKGNRKAALNEQRKLLQIIKGYSQ